MFTLEAWLTDHNIWYGVGSDFFLFLGLYWSFKAYKKAKAKEG
jgi:hypothetical protein